MHEIPLQGPIGAVFFPRLVARLHTQGFEGTLRVSLGTTLKVIYFRRGEIASAASNDEADRLHNILIHDGRLTQPQLDMARSRVLPERSLAKALIEMGFLTPTELVQGARRQVSRIMATCFDLREGTYQTEPGPLPPEVTVLGLPTKRLIFDSLMEISDRESIVHEIGSMESVYRPLGDLSVRLGALKLEPAMEQVARMFDGRATLRELSGRTSLDDFAVGKLALAIEILELAERLGVPAGGVPRTPTSFSIPIEIEAEEREPETSRVTVATVDPPSSAETSPGEPIERRPPEPMRTVDEAPESVEAGLPEPAAASARTSPAEPAETAQAEPATMPFLPDEELPAFARASGGDETWAVNPETGERVHVGPIEVTFDGTVGGPRNRSRNLGRLIGYAAVAAAAVATASWYVLHRASTEDRQVTVESAVSAVAPPAQPEPAEAPPAQPEPAAALPAEPPAPEPSAAQEPSNPPPAQATNPEPPAEHAASASFADAAGYAAARGSLEARDFPGAAALFQGLVAAAPSDHFTLQLMIACQEETVGTALARSGGDASLFVLPFSLKGRPCYRVCWGVYANKEQALAAVASLPATYAGEGAQPFVTSMARLRPPG
jgi:hypothetical protein